MSDGDSVSTASASPRYLPLCPVEPQDSTPMEPSPSAIGVKRRACTNCTVAKAKCSPYSHDICERCHRLAKHCVYLHILESRRKPRDTTCVRRPMTRDQADRRRRVQKLEEKVEDLVAQLSSLKQQPQSALPAQISSGSSLVSSHTAGESPVISLCTSERDSTSNIPAWMTQSTSPDIVTEYDGLDIVDRGLVSIEHADSLLDIFRQHYTHEFPYVIVSPDVTADSLRRHSPFLFLSIVGVTLYVDSPLQRHLGEEIKKQISKRIIMRNEKNLDLLQGLLVHVAWYHYFFRPKTQQVSLMLQLCVTMVQEMGLHRGLRDKKVHNPEGVPIDLQKSELGTAENTGRRTPDEMRAFLGAYSLSAGLAKVFRTPTIMSWTSYVDQCCQTLIATTGLPSDRWIKQCVELQTLSRRISETFCYHSPDDCKILGEGSISIAVDSFKRELERLRFGSLPDAAGHELELFLDTQFINTWLLEVAFHDSFWDGPIEGYPSATDRLPITRANMLWQSLAIGKAYFTAFLTIKTSNLFHRPFIFWSRLCYVLIIYFKTIFFQNEHILSLLDPDPDMDCHAFFRPNVPDQNSAWDSDLAAKEAEFPRIGKLLEEKLFALTSDSLSKDGDRDAMSHFALVLKVVLTGYERKMKRKAAQETGIEKESTNTSGDGQPTTSGYHQPTRNTDSHGDATRTSAAGPASMETELQDKDTNAMDMVDGLILDSSTVLPQEFFEDMIWESMLDEFTMLPLP